MNKKEQQAQRAKQEDQGAKPFRQGARLPAKGAFFFVFHKNIIAQDSQECKRAGKELCFDLTLQKRGCVVQ